MTKYREILRLYSLGISKSNIAESCECSRKTVRNVLNRAAELDISWPLSPDTTDGDLERKFYPKSASEELRKYPDLDYIHKELMRDGVSLRLLWTEYCEQCRTSGELPLMYSQFCYHHQKYAESKNATMHIHRKPGEQIEVDWAGQTATIVDRDTGEIIPAYVFVSALPYSQYAYTEAFLSMNQENWITAHINMYRYYGGATKMLIPDNLKTGIKKVDWYSPEINKTYRNMAEHYNTAVIPARIKHPKDKPSVESAVGIVSTWVIAALRNQKFFTLAELNKSMMQKLNEFNSNPFQKREGSRLSVFLEQEKPMLLPLPSTSFELATWKVATVQFNYHISVDKMHYSVPNEYIKHKVDVRITRNIIEVFYRNSRISSHPRLYGYPGQYSTNEEHMPEDHQKYLKWDANRFIAWAEKIGPNTRMTVKSILTSLRIEQQGYKSCMGLLKLAEKHSEERLEAACAKALHYTPHPSYKSVKTILLSGQYKIAINPVRQSGNDESEIHGFTRGPGYYGGK